MGKQMRVGFSGAGWMGEQFIRRLADRSDAELVAVHDPNRKAAAELMRRVGIELNHLADSSDEIINDKDIDAVMIASPNAFHAEQSLEAKEGVRRRCSGYGHYPCGLSKMSILRLSCRPGKKLGFACRRFRMSRRLISVS